MKKVWLMAFLCAALSAPAARAHVTSTSYLSIDSVERQRVSIRWDLSLHNLIWAVFIDADFNGVADAGELAAARTTISNAVLGQISLARGGQPCALAVSDLELEKREQQDFLAVSLQAACPATGRFSVGGPLFMTGDEAQRVFLSLRRGGLVVTDVISAGVWHEPQQVHGWSSFAKFVGEGVWHVLIGYDHVAFVLLLLLPSVLRSVDGRWQGATSPRTVTRDLVTIVTAFTIAHSTTLALAVTETVVLPAQPIEIAIALSIAVAAFINLMPRLSGWRLPLAFGFGLVHGFGFANVLGELDASGASLLPLLAGFNIGVELAQLGIVAVVLPLIYLSRSRRWYSGGVLPLGSCALGAAGVVWLIQRL